jgi:hypothetical protein
MLHEMRDELLGGQTPELTVLRRDDDVKTLVRIGNLPAPLQTTKRCPDRRQRDTQGGAGLFSRKVVSSAGGEVVEELRGSAHVNACIR